MRRYLALEQGRLPDTLAQALRNTDQRINDLRLGEIVDLDPDPTAPPARSA